MIRRATQQDVDAIVKMGERFYATTSYADWAPFCAESSAELVRMVVDTGILLVAERPVQLIGMVGAIIAPFVFNRKILAAHEVFWWMEPEARGGTEAWRLLQALEREADGAGCSALQMMALHSSPPQAGALYERCGYSLTEKSYTKILRSS